MPRNAHVNVEVSRGTHAQVKRMAADIGCSQRAVISRAVDVLDRLREAGDEIVIRGRDGKERVLWLAF